MASKLKSKLNLPPRFISHYTTLEGLKGIIDSKSLWASNASFLNDKSELDHALATSEQVIRKLIDLGSHSTSVRLIERGFNKLKKGVKPDTFVACFCADDDNLSQWRGYGGHTQGVSITFGRAPLTRRLISHKPMFCKIIYSKYTTASKVAAELVKELDEFEELKQLIGFTTASEKNKWLMTVIGRLLPRFKHIGFKDEREWRYVFQPEIETTEVKFRVSDVKIVPYIIVGETIDLLPITSVKVGPGPDQELTAQSIKNFLSTKGYTTVEVKTSDIPFRV